MSCYHPISAFRTTSGVVFSELSRHDIVGPIEIPCGMCIGCRMRRASDWALRISHEAQSYGEKSCFATLTYGDGKLPPNRSLEHKDYQLFMKRVRKRYGPVRFFMCGEYGPLNLRPHYHACLFGVDFRSDRVQAGKSNSGFMFYESAALSGLWTHGRAVVQDLTPETASYCARYVMKKALGHNSDTKYQDCDPETGEIIQRKPEYCAMSLKPGIGYSWFQRYHRDVYPDDFVVLDGAKRQTPKYYDKLLVRRDKARVEAISDEIAAAREERGRNAPQEQTEGRRCARERVHEARVSKLSRGDL